MKTFGWMSIAAAALAILGCNLDGKYTVGGTLTGLLGQGLVLEDNSGNSLSLASNGAFVFSGSVGNSAAYSVTVATQPSNPAQTCTVHNGSGTIDKSQCHQRHRLLHPGRTLRLCRQSGLERPVGLCDQLLHGLPDAHRRLAFAATGTTPVSLTIDPNGQFLYVVDNASNDVSVFSIDGTTGATGPRGRADGHRHRTLRRGRGPHGHLSLRGELRLEQRIRLYSSTVPRAC